MDVLGWRKPLRGAVLNRAHPLARGLIGAWLLNEGTGGRIHDASGHGNTGTLVNMEQADWLAGDHGHALEFDGVNEVVDCGTMAEMDGLTEFTVVIWAYGTSPSNSWDNLWSRHNHGYRTEGSSMSSGKIYFGVSNIWGTGGLSGSTVVSYWSTTMQGSWHQVAYRWYAAGAGDSDKVRLFFDGAEAALIYTGTAPTETHSSAANLVLGAQKNSGAGSITARIGSALVYNRALSPGEIAWLYREPYGMFAPAQTPVWAFGAPITPSIPTTRARFTPTPSPAAFVPTGVAARLAPTSTPAEIRWSE